MVSRASFRHPAAPILSSYIPLPTIPLPKSGFAQCDTPPRDLQISAGLRLEIAIATVYSQCSSLTVLAVRAGKKWLRYAPGAQPKGTESAPTRLPFLFNPLAAQSRSLRPVAGGSVTFSLPSARRKIAEAPGLPACRQAAGRGSITFNLLGTTTCFRHLTECFAANRHFTLLFNFDVTRELEITDNQHRGKPSDLSHEAHRDRVQQDVELAHRCLAGEAGAWEELYRRFHPTLVAAIQMFVDSGPDPDLVEEIAARVWYQLVRDNGRLLRRFNADHQCRLSTYLAALARNQLRSYFKSERRRHKREMSACQEEIQNDGQWNIDYQLQVDEFLATLTARERAYFVWCMESEEHNGDSAPFTANNNGDNQLRYRLRKKLREFFG